MEGCAELFNNYKGHKYLDELDLNIYIDTQKHRKDFESLVKFVGLLVNLTSLSLKFNTENFNNSTTKVRDMDRLMIKFPRKTLRYVSF